MICAQRTFADVNTKFCQSLKSLRAEPEGWVGSSTLQCDLSLCAGKRVK